MTLYTRKSFSVPASAGSKDTCHEVGHTEPDIRGKCLRCSAKVRYGVTPSGQQALRDFNVSEGEE